MTLNGTEVWGSNPSRVTVTVTVRPGRDLVEKMISPGALKFRMNGLTTRKLLVHHPSCSFFLVYKSLYVCSALKKISNLFRENKPSRTV